MCQVRQAFANCTDRAVNLEAVTPAVIGPAEGFSWNRVSKISTGPYCATHARLPASAVRHGTYMFFLQHILFMVLHARLNTCEHVLNGRLNTFSFFLHTIMHTMVVNEHASSATHCSILRTGRIAPPMLAPRCNFPLDCLRPCTIAKSMCTEPLHNIQQHRHRL